MLWDRKVSKFEISRVPRAALDLTIEIDFQDFRRFSIEENVSGEKMERGEEGPNLDFIRV